MGLGLLEGEGEVARGIACNNDPVPDVVGLPEFASQIWSPWQHCGHVSLGCHTVGRVVDAERQGCPGLATDPDFEPDVGHFIVLSAIDAGCPLQIAEQHIAKPCAVVNWEASLGESELASRIRASLNLLGIGACEFLAPRTGNC